MTLTALLKHCRINRHIHYFLIFIAGAVAACGQEPFAFPVLTIIGIAVSFYFYGLANSFKSGFLVGFIFGLGYGLVHFHWIVNPFWIEPEKTGWIAPFALITMVSGFALFWAVAFSLPFLFKTSHSIRYWLLAISWMSTEILREYIFTGFPWGLLGYIWIDTPVAQLASLIGVHGLSSLTVISIIIPFALRLKWLGFGISLILLGLAWGYGSIRLTNGNNLPLGDTTVRIIQPNVPQREKWDPLKFDLYLNHIVELSNSASNETIDLVIWPETALTIFADPQDYKNLSYWLESKPLVLGLRRIAIDKMYNSIGYISSDGVMQQVYDKQYLVPFGEFIPLESVLKFLTFSPLANNEIWDFSPGVGSQFINIPEFGLFRTLICYEAIFPHLVRTQERPIALLQITNDAWIGKFAGPLQHYAMARLRTIELGLPLLRSSNPGVSAFVDSYGQEIATVPLNQFGFIDSKMPLSLNPTVYSRAGDWPLIIFLLVSLILILVHIKRQKHTTN